MIDVTIPEDGDTDAMRQLIDTTLTRFQQVSEQHDLNGQTIEEVGVASLETLRQLRWKTVKIIDPSDEASLQGRSTVHLALCEAEQHITYRLTQHRVRMNASKQVQQRRANEERLRAVRSRIRGLESEVDRLRGIYRTAPADSRLSVQLAGQRAALELAEARCEEFELTETLSASGHSDWMEKETLESARAELARAVAATQAQLERRWDTEQVA